MLSYQDLVIFLPILAALIGIYRTPPEERVLVQNGKELLSEYDYIVVGAGSAGAVVASRLSEAEDNQVLLIEAGGPENMVSDTPAAAGLLQKGELDWAYYSEPQRYSCYGLKERRSILPRGKVLGGTSVLNFMLYVRGNPNDFDAWEEAGATGWSWRDVAPYFLRAENNTQASLRTSGYHGRSGPLTVSPLQEFSPLSQAVMDAASYLGYPVADYNGATQAAFAPPQTTIRDGQRCSTARAYLEPATRRHKNLHVLIRSQVSRVLFDSDKRAIGVQYHQYGQKYAVYARKEVILSGGTYNSAQLLMLSGVGPRKELEQHGIKVVQDLPVGQNLQDHIFTGGVYFMIKPGVVGNPEDEFNLDKLVSYLKTGNGMLASPGGVQALTFMRSKYESSKSYDWPDVELHVLEGSSVNGNGTAVKKLQGVTDVLYEKAYLENAGQPTFTVAPVLLRPKSRGFVKLRSASPFDPPIIDPNYLSDERDARVMVEAIKMALALGLSPSLRKLGSVIHEGTFPYCEHYSQWSEEYLACMARVYTSTIYHPVGTCRMGPVHDPSSVVDSDLRVIGVKGLRVIDASVMPYIVSGNTNAATIMIGEKGSDLLLGKKLAPIEYLELGQKPRKPGQFPLPTRKLAVDLNAQEAAIEKVLSQLRESSKHVPDDKEPSSRYFGEPKEYP